MLSVFCLKMEMHNTLSIVLLLALVISSVLAEIFSDCGGTREGPSGAIVSPNYPSSYPNNARCNWTITAQANEIIDLKFTFLDLDGYADSCPDVVTVYDGDTNRATPIQQLCRLKEKAELNNLYIRSTGNKMFVTFLSDATNVRPGFLATFEAHECPAMTYGTEKCNHTCDCNRDNTAYCSNLNGRCYCKPGWTSARCDVDINECADLQVDRCPYDYVTCVNTPGNFTCDCLPGLVKNASSRCVAKPNTRCVLQCSHLCGISDDSVEHCYCPYYMLLNGTNCEACKPMTYGKSCERTCRCNTAHTVTCNSVTGQCVCAEGWSGVDCSLDVNECALSKYLSICSASPNMVCVNTVGSYRCECVAGYETKPGNSSCVRKGK
ncbi:multiple epidermal growth factor-like domains protein 10 [Physella acuta]|uniref:multiple epidermal growth factor-like domains protein 10 n=1 Tax=Physella acuta TaxID=109671 RepID=UPI0027DBDE84|nr:multiple epidermal growth factor-like domains protein 10 [Physella acuta]